MTVAVTKEGRLLLSKGYGYALVDGTRKLPMKPCLRSRIGSVTKAVVTGPSGFQLMKSENIPKSTKLYGPKGFFGGIFDADIDIGIKAHAPESAKWKEWYEKITIQNLLDHESGFPQTGNNNGPAAAKMFGVSEDQLTYEQGHRYFLRVQGLLHEPGTYAYSNHNFGLWTILIPKMSGKSYLDYVREDCGQKEQTRIPAMRGITNTMLTKSRKYSPLRNTVWVWLLGDSEPRLRISLG